MSTYQANKLLVARAEGGGLSMLVRTFDRPMGLAVDARRLMIGTRDRIWSLRNAPDIAPRIEPAGRHDACYLPRSCHVTGDIGVHEMAWAGDELWVVNTRFSCLCTLDPDYSFVPRWRPPFITALAAEDRCHLNGLAIVDGRPRYVTALGETDTAGGWRADKPQGGCLLDVPTGEIVAAACRCRTRRAGTTAGSGCWNRARDGSCWWTPPRDAGRAWPTSPASPAAWRCAARTPSSASPRSERPPRWTACRWPSGGSSSSAAWRSWTCAAAKSIGLLEFQTAVEEIFDVQLLPGVRFPEVIGFQQETIQHTFIVPPEDRSPAGRSASPPPGPSAG